MRRFLFPFIWLSGLSIPCFSQTTCGTLPESIKSGTLSYIRLPYVNDAILNNFRFYYKLTIECNDDPIFNDLYIVDPLNPTTIIADLNWQQDSVKNITGVIDPCLVFQTALCHRIFYYHADARLNSNSDGYTAATLNCCRPYSAANLSYQFNLNYQEQIGGWCLICTDGRPITACLGTVYNGIASYVKVPPISIINSSPQITSNNTILSICKNRPFSYQIKAEEPDGDSIAYHFSAPRSFTVQGIYPNLFAWETLPFPAIDFKPGFSVEQPAGSGLSIDPVTGMMQGSIPDTGTYVLTISDCEYRNRVLLDSTMQDLFVEVFDCGLLPKPEASLPAIQNTCQAYTVIFSNNSRPINKNRFLTTRPFYGILETGLALSRYIPPMYTLTQVLTIQD